MSSFSRPGMRKQAELSWNVPLNSFWVFSENVSWLHKEVKKACHVKIFGFTRRNKNKANTVSDKIDSQLTTKTYQVHLVVEKGVVVFSLHENKDGCFERLNQQLTTNSTLPLSCNQWITNCFDYCLNKTFFALLVILIIYTRWQTAYTSLFLPFHYSVVIAIRKEAWIFCQPMESSSAKIIIRRNWSFLILFLDKHFSSQTLLCFLSCAIFRKAVWIHSAFAMLNRWNRRLWWEGGMSFMDFPPRGEAEIDQ